MATKTKHVFPVGTLVRLVSGRPVSITKHRRTPGADVRFTSVRNQPWYEGVCPSGQLHTFPQTSVEEVVAHPPVNPVGSIRRKTPRVLRDEALRKTMKTAHLLVWPSFVDEESAEVYRHEGKKLTQELLTEAPAGITTEVLHGLLEFALEAPDLGIIPEDLRQPLKRFMKQVRADQAALE